MNTENIKYSFIKNMNEGSVISQLKINFYRRVDKPDEVRFLDSSTLNHAICLEIAEATFNNSLSSDICFCPSGVFKYSPSTQ